MKRFRFASWLFAGLTIVAPGSSVRADSAAEKEAEEYMQTWEERGREACKDNERGCAAAGHALDRAAAAYEKAGHLEKAMAIRRMILDPLWHLDYTDYGRAAAFTLARNLQSITEYAESAQLVETAVKRFAKSDEAPDALVEAVKLRSTLGDLDKAAEDLQLLSKNYGSKKAAETSQLVVTLATAYWAQGRAKETLVFLDKWMPIVDRVDRASVRDRALAHALAGRVQAFLGALDKARAEYQIVNSLWANPEDGVKNLAALGGTERERDQRLAQTLTAVGEALFFFGERKRAEFDALRFPEYTGPGDKNSVMKFINANISEWFQKKRTALEDAEREYQKILQMMPVPPPRWVLAGAGRVGFMWSTFVSDFHRAPMPKEWSSKAPIPGTSMPGVEIKRLYREQLSSMSEPLLERARQAFLVCTSQSIKFQWFDEHSQACVVWLEKNDRKRWIPVEELKPGPKNLSFSVPTALAVP